ncbi:MAG: hypothetical protein AB8D78_03015 [Akkermansiaceae bacterium]
MFRILILLSIPPIIVTFVIRWWFGMRVLSANRRRECSCNLQKWEQACGDQHIPESRNADAFTFGEQLYQSALTEWKKQDKKAAVSREGARRFGMAVPPLAAMVAILGLIVGRIPPVAVLAIFLVAIALASVITYLSIAPELNAILKISRRVRDKHVFLRSDDEEAVIKVANALAWKKSAPPIYNLIQR